MKPQANSEDRFKHSKRSYTLIEKEAGDLILKSSSTCLEGILIKESLSDQMY